MPYADTESLAQIGDEIQETMEQLTELLQTFPSPAASCSMKRLLPALPGRAGTSPPGLLEKKHLGNPEQCRRPYTATPGSEKRRLRMLEMNKMYCSES